ncbi:MAG: carboxylating nicotinate-nucleotide diphosphorylase [Bacteroidales bacterium]
MIKFESKLLDELIELAVEEDIYTGDITTESIIPESSKAVATLTAKASGIISGIKIVEIVFKHFQKEMEFQEFFHDGNRVVNKDVIMMVKGSYPALLKAERLALNIFQRMSGIATETAKYVVETSGKTKILDTRKTVPGLRILDKMAVKDGGGTNHRMGLYDMVMIKDNHIKMAGSITKAVNQVRVHVKNTIKIEVETTNLDEVREAIAAKVDIIMLDNMSNDMMTNAVDLIGDKALTEASGNMSVDRIQDVCRCGVDFISVGALTHSVTAMDISMNIVAE